MLRFIHLKQGYFTEWTLLRVRPVKRMKTFIKKKTGRREVNSVFEEMFSSDASPAQQQPISSESPAVKCLKSKQVKYQILLTVGT